MWFRDGSAGKSGSRSTHTLLAGQTPKMRCMRSHHARSPNSIWLQRFMGSHHELLIPSIGLPTSPWALCTYHHVPAQRGRTHEKALRQEAITREGREFL